MIAIILTCTTIAYAIELLLLRYGLEKADHIPTNNDTEPMVSVIVAARNEEDRILECVDSLSKIEYPHEKLEIIIINDGSTDKTAEILASFVSTHSNMKFITASPGENVGLLGKTNAVAQGIESSRGDILMFTDADCRVPESWVRETVKCFTDDVGIVGGFTVLDASRPFEGIQMLDWIFLFGLSSATAGWNLPLTVIGNNLSVRRSAYNATGGYRAIPFSVTEDYALVQAILNVTDYRVAFPVNPASVVKSKACQNWHQLFRQKQRWGVGGLDMVLRGMMVMLMAWIARCVLLIAAFQVNLSTIILAIILICYVDLRFLWKPLRRFSRLGSLKYFIAFELYLTLYMLILPAIAFLSKDVVWKERRL